MRLSGGSCDFQPIEKLRTLLRSAGNEHYFNFGVTCPINKDLRGVLTPPLQSLLRFMSRVNGTDFPSDGRRLPPMNSGHKIFK